jgi:hypothetical protein
LLGFFTQPRACFGGAWLPGWAAVGRFQGRSQGWSTGLGRGALAAYGF